MALENLILDDDDLLETLRRLVADNEADLVRDMVFQGQPKRIGQLVTNNMVEDREGFFVRIVVPNSEVYLQQGSNTLWLADYAVEMHIVDFARMQPEDTHFPFETVARQYRLFVGRLVELMKAQTSWLKGERGRYRRPVDRAKLTIRKRDDSDIFADAAGNPYAACLGKINFNFEGQC